MWGNEAPIYRRGLTFNKVVSSSIEYHIFMSKYCPFPSYSTRPRQPSRRPGFVSFYVPCLAFFLLGRFPLRHSANTRLLEALICFQFCSWLAFSLNMAEVPYASLCKFVSSFSFGKYLEGASRTFFIYYSRTGKVIKTLRSDRGGKYMSREFDDFLKEEGIAS